MARKLAARCKATFPLRQSSPRGRIQGSGPAAPNAGDKFKQPSNRMIGAPSLEAKNAQGCFGKTQEGSGINKHGGMFVRFHGLLHQFFQMSDGVRGKDSIRTDITDFRGNLLKYQDIFSTFNHVNNEALFIVSWASLNTAFHVYFPL